MYSNQPSIEGCSASSGETSVELLVWEVVDEGSSPEEADGELAGVVDDIAPLELRALGFHRLATLLGGFNF